jgi:hypothetical protein
MPAAGSGGARPDDDPELAQRFTKDPFFVLEAAPTATRRELDAVAAALIHALERGEWDAARYPTPLGERIRDAGSVKAAAHELRDPERRIVQEVWARLPVRWQPIAPPPAPAPWCGGDRALGWRRR